MKRERNNEGEINADGILVYAKYNVHMYATQLARKQHITNVGKAQQQTKYNTEAENVQLC